jgi:hypothetical protein
MRDALLAEVDGASELNDVERLLREGARELRPDGAPPPMDAYSLFGTDRLPDSLLGAECKGLVVSSHTSKVRRGTEAASTTSTKKPPKKHSFLAKLGATLGASALFAAFDYAGFNLSKKNPTALKVYRAAQLTASGAAHLQADEGFRLEDGRGLQRHLASWTTASPKRWAASAW